jgi:uncharacterized membrane protein
MEQDESVVKHVRVTWKWGVFLVAGLLLIAWLINTPPGILGKADAVGYAVCHRIDVRSFHIGVRQMPLCARCTGQYLGAVLGLAYQAIIGRRRSGAPPKRVIGILFLFFLMYAVDGLNSYLHLPPLLKLLPSLPRLYEPSNVLRLFTGTGMGLVIAAALYPAFVSSVYKDTNPQPAVSGIRSLLILTGLGVLVDLLILMDLPIILFPAALISTGGVLLLLIMVYTIVWLMIFRQESRYTKLSQIILPLTAGFVVALAQIAIFDLVRFILTGTWSGFIFG